MKNKDSILTAEIQSLEIPTILKNGLIENGISTVGQIIALNRHEVQMLRNFGKKRIESLNEFLTENKLELRGF